MWSGTPTARHVGRRAVGGNGAGDACAAGAAVVEWWTLTKAAAQRPAARSMATTRVDAMALGVRSTGRVILSVGARRLGREPCEARLGERDRPAEAGAGSGASAAAARRREAVVAARAVLQQDVPGDGAD